MDDKSLENIHASSDNLYVDVRLIVETAQRQAYTAVNVALVQRNWLIGKRIAEEELKGESRAEYGGDVKTKALSSVEQGSVRKSNTEKSYKVLK